MVVALTGEKLAGKGTTAQYIEQRREGRIIRFSQILEEILHCLHRPVTRAEFVSLGTALRTLYGDDILAEAIYNTIKTQPDTVWIIDGMRYLQEYDILSRLPRFNLLNITADIKLRYQRARNRTEKEDESSMTFEEFQRRENDPTEQEIPSLQHKASATIHNDTTIQDLYHEIDIWLAAHSIG